MGSELDVVERASRVAGQFIEERQTFIDSLVRATEESIPQLERDERLHTMLDTSVTENIVQVLNLIHNKIDTGAAAAPAGAIAYAQRLAQRDVSVSELHGAYRLGLLMFLETAYEVARRMHLDDPHTLSCLMSQSSFYNDRVSADVGRAYDTERIRWLSTSAVARQVLLEQFLKDPGASSATLESELDYSMAFHHVAFRMWVDESTSSTIAATFDRTARVVSEQLSGAGGALVNPVDDHESRGWIPLRQRQSLDAGKLQQALRSAGLKVAVTVGPALPGAAGFRRSHALATDLQEVAIASTACTTLPTALVYDDLAPVVLLSRDLVSARDYVQRTLGHLAHDDERSEQLRETLLTFLECNRSYAATAERMILHRNTIRYRVQQACLVSERGIEDGRAAYALHTALLLARWLGPVIAMREPAR